METNINAAYSVQNILGEASDIVFLKRGGYGNPERSFQKIAEMWASYLGSTITPKDVAMMMILLKVCRHSVSEKRDNLVDIAGYAQCAQEISNPFNKGEIDA